MTISMTGVAGPTSANMPIVTPISSVLTIRILRNPKRRRMPMDISFIPIAAAAAGIISNPDCHAGKPRPTW